MKRFASLALGAIAALTLMTAARADLRTSYSLGPIVFPGATVPSVRDVAVDNNPGSAWHGFVFVTDAGGPAATPQRRVMIFRPDPVEARTAATSYVDTGITISVPDQTGGNGSGFAPFGVFVGPDDTVWVTNYDDRTVETIALPETVPAAGSLGTTTIQIKMADFDVEAAAFSGAANGSSPRAVAVTGPVTDAHVFLGNYDGTTKMGQMYTVIAPNAGTTGTADHIWSRTVTSSVGPYGISADHNNNAYIPVRVAAGGHVLVKVTPDGTVVPPEEFPAILPAGYTDAVYSSSEFVRDASVPGGGYVYYSFRNGTTGGTVVLRYDLSGNYLDGFGQLGAAPVPNFTTLAITGSTTQYLGADDKGNVYQRFVNGANSAVIKIFKRAPFVVDAAASTSASAAVKSSPTAVDGVVTFGANDGKLYAYTTADGNLVAGFPVDVSAALGATVKILGRPAVYIVDLAGTPTKYIYFLTDRGDVCRVGADGGGFVAYSAVAGGANNNGTPAVAPDGTVYAGVNTAPGAIIVKLNPDMTFAASTDPLTSADGTVSSVALDAGGKLYIGLTHGVAGDIAVLNGASLVPLSGAGIASGEGVTAPPYVNGIDMYVGTLAGRFYKLNSANSSPDAVFGGGTGYAVIGEPLPNSPFPDSNTALATFFVGSDAGKVWSVNAATGLFGPDPFYNTGDATARVGGLVINRETNILAFGTSAGKFYEVPLLTPAQAQVFPGYGALTTTPTVDRSTGRFLIGSDDSNVYAFPAP